MTSRHLPDELESPRDAAHWFARMHSGDVTDEDRQAFHAWRTADPGHDRAYRRLVHLWNATLAVPEPRLRRLMDDGGGAGAPPAPLPRRRFGMALAGVCALAAIGFAGGGKWSGSPASAMTLVTRRGERRQVTLPDGSVLTLNTDTRAVARFDEKERFVALQRGEAFFDVHAEAARSFVVDAGHGRVTVTGTRFNVRRDAEAMQVSVQSGAVLVESGAGRRRAVNRLAAGQRLIARPGQPPDAAHAVDVGSLAAWRQGKVIFDDVPLAQAIDELNRYLAHPVSFEADSLRRHHVSGVFSVDDPDAVIRALPDIVPVRVLRLEGGLVRIVAR